MRNKDRLYVAFQHRNGRPGFHWSIMLSQKKENGGSKPTVFDATNTIAPGYENGEWSIRVRKDDLMGYGNFIARIIIAKITPGQADILDGILMTAPVKQGDPSWTCVAWVKGAIEVLRGSGGEFSTIVDGDTVEKLGVPLSSESLRGILQRKHVYTSLKHVPTRDIRNLDRS